jgi:hypothetical protein
MKRVMIDVLALSVMTLGWAQAAEKKVKMEDLPPKRRSMGARAI